MGNCDYCARENVPVVTMNPAALAARMARPSGRKTDICSECLDYYRTQLGEQERRRVLREVRDD